MQLIITIGPPGAGKSTWADANLPPNCLRLERDRMREAFWGSRQAYHNDPMDPQAKSFIIGSAMFQAGRNWPQDRPIALTDTCVMWPLVKRFWPLRAKKHLVIFDLPDHVLRQRNRDRPPEHRLPPELLENYIADFRQPANRWWDRSNCTKEIIRA